MSAGPLREQRSLPQRGGRASGRPGAANTGTTFQRPTSNVPTCHDYWHIEHPGDRLWRKEVFLSMLERMGASDQELLQAGKTVEARDEALARLGFRGAAEQVAAESLAHVQEWCARRGMDCERMSEEEIDDWLAAQLTEFRGAP